ncbi:unnamed protein product, partial [Musa hybrid cultivar]
RRARVVVEIPPLALLPRRSTRRQSSLLLKVAASPPASERTRMSRRSNHGKSHKVDLKLNLAPPMREDASRRAATVVDSPRGSSSSSSCLSSETEQGLPCQTSPEATSMVLAACPRCLMYVMLPEEDPKCCPKCKNAVLLDFLCSNRKT